MELKEKIYPVLPNERNIPNAPPLVEGDGGQSFRLKKISDIQAFLEKEVNDRETLTKKYLRYSNSADNLEAGLTIFTIGAGAGGIALLSTIVAIPLSLTLEAVALASGVSALASKYVVRKTRNKSEKHLQIKMLAESKLNTIHSHISKAISDNKIDHEEFILILDEYEKYKTMKEDIRSKAKKKAKVVDEESLIERGRQEARESYRRLVEKNHGGTLPY